MSDKRITELTETSSVNETDVIPIVQSNVTKKITSKNLIKGMTALATGTVSIGNEGYFNSGVPRSYDIISATVTIDGGTNMTKADIYTREDIANHRIYVRNYLNEILKNVEVTYRIRYIVN